MERCARPTLGSRGYSTYLVFGTLGWLTGLAVILVLGHLSGVSPLLRVLLAVVPAAALLASLLLSSTRFFTARVVFYEKALIALGATGLALYLADEPLKIGLDLTMLGIGTFLAVGRLGCFCVACCHGRPATFGVRYGWRHTASGYPKRWVGIRVFPIQLLDSWLSASAVLLGASVQLAAHEPGTPLATYACVYGLGRFLLEFWRGDAVRRYFAGVSEAQRTAALLALVVALYRPTWWTISTALLLVLASGALVVAHRTRRLPHLWLTSARHVAEVDAVLARLIASGPTITTTQGLELKLQTTPTEILRLEMPPSVEPRTVDALARHIGRNWTVVGIEPSAILLEARVPQQALVDG